jgi:hypothetical protein
MLFPVSPTLDVMGRMCYTLGEVGNLYNILIEWPQHEALPIVGTMILNWILKNLGAGAAQSASWLTTDWTPGFDPQQRQRIFLLLSASRPALASTQPPVQWVPVVLSPGLKRGQGVMLTTHPHLVPRLSKSRSYTYSPPMRLHGM